MAPEIKQNGKFPKGRETHRECSVWSTSLRYKTSEELHANIGLDGNNRSVGYGKQYMLLYGLVLRRKDCHALRRALDFVVDSQ